MSAVPDLVYPETRGERPADFESSLKYSAALIRTAMRDPAVHRLMTEVHQRLKPQASFRIRRLTGWFGLSCPKWLPNKMPDFRIGAAASAHYPR